VKITAIILVFALAAAVVLFLLAHRRGPLASSEDVQAGMIELADAAVRMARDDHATTLDYSVESVKDVETILGTLYDQSAKQALNQDQQVYFAVRYGAYIGEVIRREWGGKWERDHPVAGPGSLPIESRDHESFPVGWCFKRLKNGPEDNVWHKFQVLYVKDGHGGA